MLKIKNVKAIRYKGYALYSTSRTTCVTCKTNKHKYIPFSTIDYAKSLIDDLINGYDSENSYALWDLNTMLKHFKNESL